MDVCEVGVYQSGRELFGQLRDFFVREDGMGRLRLVFMIRQLGLTWKLQSAQSWMIQLLLVVSCILQSIFL